MSFIEVYPQTHTRMHTHTGNVYNNTHITHVRAYVNIAWLLAGWLAGWPLPDLMA